MTHTYLLYTVQGYDKYIAESDGFLNLVNISVVAESEKEALAKAKKILKKKNYRMGGVMEHFYDRRFDGKE